MDVDTESGRLDLALIAGLVARRVVPWVGAPTNLRRGQRIAVIRFGSRAEIELPRGYRPSVAVGQRVRAGETVLASLEPSPEPSRESHDSGQRVVERTGREVTA